MQRLLCIVGSINAGGAETFLMKIYRNLDHTRYQMDFCVAVKEPGIYDKEILDMGGRILYTTPKSKGFIKSFRSIKTNVFEGKYKYVMRVSQHSLSGLELIAAKKGGASTTIFRSSNTQTGGGIVNRLLHKLCLPITIFVPDIKMAPSTEAAIFMFGKRKVKKGEVLILPNALDTQMYAYNKSVRERYRRTMGIEQALVIGHIGRFTHQKNHMFLIDIFVEIKRRVKNTVLLLIGQGELEAEVRDKVDKVGLANDVKFLNIRRDIPELLSTMDVFVFPSFYEGMPNTVIEAQTAGLPCVLSDSITKEAQVTDLVSFMSLKSSADKWAEMVISKANLFQQRECYAAEMREKGYDIKQSVNTFVKTVFGKE